jgi:hypothetical protein
MDSEVTYLYIIVGVYTMIQTKLTKRLLRPAAGLCTALVALSLTTCEMLTSPDLIESIPLPPGLPVAHVMQNGVEILEAEDYQGGDCQFVLNWLPIYEGELLPDADYRYITAMPESGEDQQYVEDLKTLYLKWKEYEQYMDSRPYWPPVDAKRLSVWAHQKLINAESEDRLQILRYWPRDLLAKNQPLTVAAWYTTASNARRKAAFLAAKKQMEAQMAALKASPFWDVWYLQGTDFHNYPLQEMYHDMENFISTGNIVPTDLYKDPQWADYYVFNEEEDKMEAVRMNVGSLYTVFFGPVPRRDDYLVKTDTYPGGNKATYFVFPVEPLPEE